MVYFVALFVLIVCLRAFLFRGPFAGPVAPPPRGILDMHCHTAGIGAKGSGAWVSDSLRKSWKFPLYLRIFETDQKTLNEQGDEVLLEIIARRIRESEYVKDAVILAMDCPYDEDGERDLQAGEVYVPNRFVGEALKNYPELHFGASVHPARSDALEELRWSKEMGAVLLKWLPNIQNIDPSNERYRPFYQELVRLDLPLLTHVGAEDSFSKADDRLGDPRLLKLPLECGVRVIAAHVASSGSTQGQQNIDRLLEMMPLYPNLVADISTLTQLNRRKYLKLVLNDPRLKGRLMYGTDHPLTNTPMVTPLQFPLQLTLEQMWKLWCIKNPWDRDVALKSALGFPEEVFLMARNYLKL
ncbi:MAG: amidohydrolase family protein [Vulcanimicrobiota bacterium]